MKVGVQPEHSLGGPRTRRSCTYHPSPTYAPNSRCSCPESRPHSRTPCTEAVRGCLGGGGGLLFTLARVYPYVEEAVARIRRTYRIVLREPSTAHRRGACRSRASSRAEIPRGNRVSSSNVGKGAPVSTFATPSTKKITALRSSLSRAQTRKKKTTWFTLAGGVVI